MSNNKSKTKASAWNEQLERLLEIVDSECIEDAYTPTKRKQITVLIALFAVLGVGTTIVILSAGYSIWQYTSVLTQTAKLEYLSNQLPAIVALSVAVVAFCFSFPIEQLKASSHNEWAEFNYCTLVQKHEIPEDERPIFKALINMQCREFGVSLLAVYKSSQQANSDVFSKDALLKSLYS